MGNYPITICLKIYLILKLWNLKRDLKNYTYNKILYSLLSNNNNKLHLLLLNNNKAKLYLKTKTSLINLTF